jgi:transcriptional regulator
MYIPPDFAETRLPVLHEAIHRARLATLVTVGGDGLEASPVPMLLDPAQGPYGTLSGHLARGNPQGRWSSVPALALFTGPEAYVSPAWYPSKAQSGKVVPTWNYVAVHAHGTVVFFDDPDRLLAVVGKLTEKHEAGRPRPWSVSDAPADYIRAMLKGIIGFTLTITRLEGKWKLSQNRTPEDRQGVVEGLTREGGAAETAVAETMASPLIPL